MQIKAAIAAFLADFSAFESKSLGIALQALSNDLGFVKQTQDLLGFKARLTLLERLAFSRGISGALMFELKDLLIRAKKLSEQRDQLSLALHTIEGERDQTLDARIKTLAAEVSWLEQGFAAFAVNVEGRTKR